MSTPEPALNHQSLHALSPAARAAYASLMLDLAELADGGFMAPCLTVGWAFQSEDPDERATAALTCLECPAMVACARFALANDETWGVWGGVDVTPVLGRRDREAPRRRLARIVGGAA